MHDLIKKFSSTAVAFLILILIVGYFFVFEKGKPEKEEQKSALFPDIKKEEIISLKFNYPDSTIILSKEAQNWFLIKNNKRYKADSFTINSIIENFVGLKVDSDVSDDDNSLSEYGLINPKVEVIASIENKLYSIKIGSKSPIGSGVYLKEGSVPGVKLIAASLVWPFLDRTFNEIRDREIINLDEDRITEVKFEAGYFNQTFIKKDGRWVGDNIAENVDINHLEIEGIVRSFSDLRVVGFESDEPQSLSKYGLDEPSAVLTLTEGERKIEYSFGNKKENTDYYMKLSLGEPVYLVSIHNFDQLPQKIDDIRITKLLNFRENKIANIKIVNNKNTIILSKNENEWFIENSEDQIDQSKISALLAELIQLEVSEFVDDNPKDLAKYGLNAADISITLGKNQSNSLFLGNEKDHQVYAKKAEKNSVYLIDKYILTFLPESKDDLLLITETDSEVVESN